MTEQRETQQWPLTHALSYLLVLTTVCFLDNGTDVQAHRRMLKLT